MELLQQSLGHSKLNPVGTPGEKGAVRLDQELVHESEGLVGDIVEDELGEDELVEDAPEPNATYLKQHQRITALLVDNPPHASRIRFNDDITEHYVAPYSQIDGTHPRYLVATRH